MGYYTSYSLTIDPPEKTDEVANHVDREVFYGLDWFRASDGKVPTYDACKWYSHQQDMTNLSLAFPDVTFILEGDGEERGDHWRKRFRNGKVQKVVAELPRFPEWEE